MDYYLLTDLTARIGYELAISGVETFRVEEMMRRTYPALVYYTMQIFPLYYPGHIGILRTF